MASPLKRGLDHARRFPRPFWAIVGGGAVASLGGGVLVPYWGLYLVTSLHASGAQVSRIFRMCRARDGSE